MGYYTNFIGEIDFQMEDKKWHILKWILDRDFAGLMDLNRNHISIDNNWKNRSRYLEDIICFIKKNGTITHLDIHAEGEEDHDVHRYVLRENQLQCVGFDFAEETKRPAADEEVIKLLTDYFCNYTCNVSSEFVQDAEESNLHDEMHKVEKELEYALYEALTEEEAKKLFPKMRKIGITVTLMSREGKIIIQDGTCSWMDFQEDPSKVQEIKPWVGMGKYQPKEVLYSALDFDTPEKGGRQMMMGETLVPLQTEIFPDYPRSEFLDEALVVLPSGEKVTICSICKHRARRALNMCKSCKPELL